MANLNAGRAGGWVAWALVVGLAVLMAPAAVGAAGAIDDPPELTDLMAKGKLAADLGDHDEAIAAFSKVTEAPNASEALRAEALVRLGAARRSAGDDKGALEAFERAWKDHASHDPQALALLVHTLTGVLPGAERWAQIWRRVALVVDPSDPAHPALKVIWPDVPPPPRRAYTGLPIEVDLRDTSLYDVFRMFADVTGLNVVVNPGVRGEATIKIQPMPWDQALERILAPHGLVAQHVGNVVRIGFPGEFGLARKFTGRPLGLDVKDEDLRDVLTSLARQGGETVVIDPAVAGKVTLKLNAVPWDQAFDIVVSVNGLRWAREGGVIRVRVPAR